MMYFKDYVCLLFANLLKNILKQHHIFNVDYPFYYVLGTHFVMITKYIFLFNSTVNFTYSFVYINLR